MSRAQFFAWIQQKLPTRLLSTWMFHLTQIRKPWFKNTFIKVFMKAYDIDLKESQIQDPERFENFNAFFTRALKVGARPLDPDPFKLLSPVDGTVSQLGDIVEHQLIQAKGHHYSLTDLVGNAETAALFVGGSFCTIYLAPYNYHRIHMPMAGHVKKWAYVPGRLFSVNSGTVENIPNLFAINERLVAIFETRFGPMAMILVGALMVSGLETVWSGRVSPPHSRRKQIDYYSPVRPTPLGRGAEMGRFNMGSTVILLTAPNAVRWLKEWQPGKAIKMGEGLAQVTGIKTL
jgi:phosphatidylserine decarboxylase